MRLTTLELEAFRSFEHLTLDTDAPRVFIAGVNGSGKTSIREAIRWALTGRCAVTDGRGSGVEHLMPQGTSAVSVGVNIHGIGRVQRWRKTGATLFGVEGMSGDQTAQQAGLFLKLGTAPAYLDAVLETEHFLRLHHADAKALVLGLLNVTVQVDGKNLTLDELDAAYAGAFEERKIAKVRLKAFTIPPLPRDEAFPTVEQIEAQLTKLRGEIETTAASEGRTSGRRAAIQQQLLSIAVLKKPVPPPAFPGEIERVQARIAELESIVEAPSEPVAAVPTDDDPAQRVIWLRQQIDTLSAHQPGKGCVLDGKVVCDTAKIRFTNRVKALKAELEELGPVEAALAPTEAPDATHEAFYREQELKVHRIRLEQLLAQQSKHDVVAAHNGLLEQQEAALKAELETLPVESSVAEQNPVDALKARIQKGEMLLSRARTYWQQVEAHEKALAESKALETTVEELEARCDALGPKGLRVQALQETIGAFEARINTVTEPFGWTVKFRLEPWGVEVNGRRVETYSESEQFRIGIAIQLAVATVSGLSFAIVDRLDMLDFANRRTVGEMLMGAPLEQIVILGTREPDNGLPQKAGVKSYRFALAEGRTQVVEAA